MEYILVKPIRMRIYHTFFQKLVRNRLYTTEHKNRKKKLYSIWYYLKLAECLPVTTACNGISFMESCVLRLTCVSKGLIQL